MLTLLISMALIVTPTTNGKHNGWRNKPVHPRSGGDNPTSVPVADSSGPSWSGGASSSTGDSGAPVSRRTAE